MSNDGRKNLIPISSTEEAREKGKKGGLKSAEARRKKKTFQEVFSAIMQMEIEPTEDSAAELCKKFSKYSLTYQDAIALMITQKAAGGNLSAAEYIRDTLGEKPTEKISTDTELNVNIKVVE